MLLGMDRGVLVSARSVSRDGRVPGPAAGLLAQPGGEPPIARPWRNHKASKPDPYRNQGARRRARNFVAGGGSARSFVAGHKRGRQAAVGTWSHLQDKRSATRGCEASRRRAQLPRPAASPRPCRGDVPRAARPHPPASRSGAGSPQARSEVAGLGFLIGSYLIRRQSSGGWATRLRAGRDKVPRVAAGGRRRRDNAPGDARQSSERRAGSGSVAARGATNVRYCCTGGAVQSAQAWPTSPGPSRCAAPST